MTDIGSKRVCPFNFGQKRSQHFAILIIWSSKTRFGQSRSARSPAHSKKSVYVIPLAVFMLLPDRLCCQTWARASGQYIALLTRFAMSVRIQKRVSTDCEPSKKRSDFTEKAERLIK